MQTIIFGDCRDVMNRFDSETFHLIVTSPPYNLGVRYCGWNDDLPFAQYLEFCQQWLSQCYRILVRGGRLCLNLPLITYKGKRNLLYEYLRILRGIEFIDREIIIWVKRRKSDNWLVCKRRLFGSVASPRTPEIRSVCEAIVVLHKEDKHLMGKCSDISPWEYDAWTKDVWEIDTAVDRRHPAPFPYEIPMRLIKLYSYVGNIVLDPFAGTGTTLKACQNLGRIGVGIEIGRNYLPLIQENVGDALETFDVAERVKAELR